MACTPIALDEAPSSSHVDCVPRVPKTVAFKFNARLVASGFAVSLYDHAMKASIAIGQDGAASKFAGEKRFGSSGNFNRMHANVKQNQ